MLFKNAELVLELLNSNKFLSIFFVNLLVFEHAITLYPISSEIKISRKFYEKKLKIMLINIFEMLENYFSQIILGNRSANNENI